MQRISEHAPQKDIAAHTGLEQSSISRWKLATVIPRWEAVVAIARAYRRPPVEAFLAAGYITKDEADQVIQLISSPSELSTEELLAELGRRILGRENGDPGK